jgi:pyridoxamine 5'-phosphate oxidase-like protein
MIDALASLQDQTFARATEATAASFPLRHRLTGAQLAGYLDRHAFAVVATTRADGRPHATVCSYVRRETTFWLPTVAGAVRERNVRHQSWVSLVVSQGDHGDQSKHVLVIIEGTGAVVPPGEVPPDVRVRADGDWVGSWIRVRAERMLSYAADGALPADGALLAEGSTPVP